MGYAVGVVTPVTVSTTSESLLTQILIPQQGPAGPPPTPIAGTSYRITALCSFSVGGTAGTITCNARIGGLTGQLLGTCVTGTLTLSTTGAAVLIAYCTLLTAQSGAASNWSGAASMSGTGTGATVIGAGVATPTLGIVTANGQVIPQYFALTVTLSSATSSLTMNSALLEQVV